MTEIDFEKEIVEILQSGNRKLYSKKTLDGKQRIKFSILAHLKDLVSYTVSENGNAFLCISPPLTAVEEIVEDEKLYGFFGHLVNQHIASKEDVEFYKLDELYQQYLKNIRENSFTGYKRYYEIMQDWLSNCIQQLRGFKNTEIVTELVRERAPKKRSTVFAPKNDGLFCVSVDVKSSVFQGYKDLGVFEQNNWEEFISQHTNDKLLIQSKNLRLSVFGRCDVFKKNQIIINNTITPFWNRIVNTIPSALEKILFLSGDECIFGFQNIQQAITMEQGLVAMQFPAHIVVTVFKLEKKSLEKHDYYLRHFISPSNKTDIKAASPNIVMRATADLRKMVVDYTFGGQICCKKDIGLYTTKKI